MSVIYSLYSILLPLCQFSPCDFPSCPLRLDLLFSLPPTPSPVFLSTLFITFIFPIIISCLSSFHSLSPTPSLHFPVFSSPSLFSVSVEPLWLHRYTDCWLCRGGGMLFRHSTRRYCTSALCLLQPKLLHQTSPSAGSILYSGCTYNFPCRTTH